MKCPYYRNDETTGAAALCQHMIGRGRSGQVLGRHMVSLAPGLGLSNRLVIDQHFSQRHRMGRLFSAVSLNPFLIGVGIDEDTAAFIDPDDNFDGGTLTLWPAENSTPRGARAHQIGIICLAW